MHERVKGLVVKEVEAVAFEDSVPEYTGTQKDVQ
jgi:hypothetical protein